MKDRTCTCKRFEIDEIPCQHAVAIINEMNRDPYQYCSIYYMKETILEMYSETVFLMAKEDEWDILQQVKDFILLPPQHKTKSGRPKTQKFKSPWEKLKNGKCTRYIYDTFWIHIGCFMPDASFNTVITSLNMCLCQIHLLYIFDTSLLFMPDTSHMFLIFQK
ncbi:uncharacterized protein LOC126668487 [Mercurialis annua]|uniref:uncharacterized protein LOC126668487 n=1 Tax=Mercurialis annua TaxID=3986 RepID=UPI00215E39D0|nr:uncharacterized protein LOC126668487 [Mercurialis annua]